MEYLMIKRFVVLIRTVGRLFQPERGRVVERLWFLGSGFFCFCFLLLQLFHRIRLCHAFRFLRRNMQRIFRFLFG